MQRPRYQVPREHHEIRVPSLGQLDENRLGFTHGCNSDPVLRVKRSDTESNQIRTKTDQESNNHLLGEQ